MTRKLVTPGLTNNRLYFFVAKATALCETKGFDITMINI